MCSTDFVFFVLALSKAQFHLKGDFFPLYSLCLKHIFICREIFLSGFHCTCKRYRTYLLFFFVRFGESTLEGRGVVGDFDLWCFRLSLTLPLGESTFSLFFSCNLFVNWYKFVITNKLEIHTELSLYKNRANASLACFKKNKKNWDHDFLRKRDWQAYILDAPVTVKSGHCYRN